MAKKVEGNEEKFLGEEREGEGRERKEHLMRWW